MHLLSKTERNNYMQIEIIRLFSIHLIFCILSTLKSNFLIFEHKCRFSLLTPLFVLHNKGIVRNITIDAFKLEADESMNEPYDNHALIYFPVSYIASGICCVFVCICTAVQNSIDFVQLDSKVQSNGKVGSIFVVYRMS